MTTALLIALLLFACCAYARWIDKHIGFISQPSLAAYIAAAKDKVTTSEFMLFVLYPFWWSFRDMNPRPEAAPPPALAPAEPAPPTYVLDIDRTVSRFTIELKQLSPGIPDALLKSFVSTFSAMLHFDYHAPFPESPNEAALSAQAAAAFSDFIKTLPLQSSERATTAAFLYQAASRDAVDQLFHQLSRNNFFEETFSRYLTAVDWGRALTGTVPKRLLDAGFDTIGAPDSHAHLLANLRDFHDLAYAPVPITLPAALRFEGAWIIAPQGRGKTTLLSTLLKADLEQVQQGKATVIIIDSKGDLVEPIREYKEFGSGGTLSGKLVLIEPAANLAINPLDIGSTAGHSIALLEYIFLSLFETEPAPKQLLVLRKLILACRAIPGATIMTMREMLIYGWEKYKVEILASDPLTAEYFATGQFDDKEARETKKALLWRIEDLITRVDALKGMFTSPETRVDLGRLMDTPHVIVIDNSVAKLTDSGAELFGRFFLALILGAAQQRAGRAEKDKLPVYVYLDEAASVISRDKAAARIVQTCRSQKIGMTFAHQFLTDLKVDEVRSALGNCAIRFANPDKDAKALADDFRTDDATLQSISKGYFALYVRDHTPKPLIVNVPDVPASGWPKMTAEELEGIREEMRKAYSFTPPSNPPPPAGSPDPDDTSPKQWG